MEKSVRDNDCAGRCQELVAALACGDERYAVLDVAQLLKHVRGLAARRAPRFGLHYINFDLPGRVSESHRAEFVRFDERVGSELSFKAITYQELMARRTSSAKAYADYLANLTSRYVHLSATPPDSDYVRAAQAFSSRL